MINSVFRRAILVFVSSIFLASCAYPVSRVDQGGEVTAIYFEPQPEDVHVFVDGVDKGSASPYDGRQAVLSISPGRHLVELRSGGGVLLSKDVYVGDGVLLKVTQS